jgi:phage shock protein A
MGIFSRLGEIINANISGMLDRAENPMKMVKLMIHEMEDTLTEVKSSAAEVIADRIRLERQLRQLEASAEDWESKAALAVSKNREDLAREAIEQKLSVDQEIGKIHRQLREVNELVEHYQQDIARLEDKLMSARKRKKELESKRKLAEHRQKVEQKIYDVRTRAAHSQFDAYEERIDRMEAEAEVNRHSNDRDLARKFDDLEREGAVEAELERLKKMRESIHKKD